ncbi:MAG TPA: NAD-dependent epimerase/dehydratase family protein [Pirellulales bacterium]|nr:NAD-dependent epimerase/dehydratase family protein [Pirellulales bacterium]
MIRSIADLGMLEDLLSEPTAAVVETMRRLEGDLVFLGVGGKMGPTMARMARRASDLAGVRRKIYGVARFSSPELPERLQSMGIEPLRCDLLDPQQAAKLPEVPNVVSMCGMKFGASQHAALTWAMNCLVPANICQKYRHSRIVAFSSGNVYGLTPVCRGGSVESDPPTPVGEYAMSAVGRERMYEHFSLQLGIPTVLVRLNYACELRYGVLVDLAQRVLAGETIDLAMGNLNTIWQGDANAMTLALFDHVSSPAAIMNITGPETLSVRWLCEQFATRFGTTVSFIGTEAPDALLNNAQRAISKFGYPRVGIEQLIDWIADWLNRGGATLGKPTHFESREGKF